MSFAVDWIRDDDILVVSWLAGLESGTLGLPDLFDLWNNQHPVGAQVLVSFLVARLVGFHPKVLIALSVGLVFATGAIVAASLCDRAARTGADPGRFWRTVGLATGATLLALHPLQMDHLLWAFELGWFMVNACVVANAVLIERCGARALPAAVVLCLVATFSSAQGAFAWLAAALQIALRVRTRARGPAVMLLLMSGAAAVLRVALHRGGLAPGTAPTGGALPVLAFALDLIGALFGTRDRHLLPACGALLLVLVMALGLRLLWRGGDPGRLRMAAALIAFSLLAILGFAEGRLGFGLEWALDSFHHAPLLIPLALGALILVAAADTSDGARRDRPSRILAALLAGALAMSWIASWSYGGPRAWASAEQRGYAAWAACEGHVPPEVALRASGAEPYGSALAALMPRLRPLCGETLSRLAARLTHRPPLFTELASTHPEAAAALDVIWQDYATEPRLQAALKPGNDATPQRLIDLAKAEARRGPPFDHKRWAPFAPILLDLP